MKEEGKPQKYLSGKLASGLDIRNIWLRIARFSTELICIILYVNWMK
jgi:hypothetical protein